MTQRTLAELRRIGAYHHTVGAGTIEQDGVALRLTCPPTAGDSYQNAQLDDYRTLPRRRFAWHPPLRLEVEARFSHEADRLQGTAGFGFWNDPFMMTERRPPALPRALWFFFASPPSDMALAQGVPGRGWKAATMDAQRPAFYALAPAAPVAVLLMRVRPLYDRLWPLAQRALGVSEALLDHDMTAWHRYVIEWRAEGVRFAVDGATVLEAEPAPRGPLGLVIWLDNQAMVVTPQGRLHHSLVARSEAQSLTLRSLIVERA